MQKIELLEIPDQVYTLTGQFILLFAQVEWLVGNVIFLSEIKKEEYNLVKDFSVTQKYLENVLSLNFSKKLQTLKKIGFDTAQLELVANYRNIIGHGLVFKKEGTLTIKKLSKPETEADELNNSRISNDIEILKIEGGKLLDFIKDKGYEYISPKENKS